MGIPKAALLLALALSSSARADDAEARWIGSWSAAVQPAPTGTLARFERQSLRLIVHASAGGGQWRVRLSNRFGNTPLVIGHAHLARRASGADIEPASDRTLSFGGQRGVTIAPHATALSDPVALEAPAGADLAVSLYLPQASAAATTHFLALQTNYVSTPGDATAAARFPVARTIGSWPFLAGIDTLAPAGGQTIVAFGDSQFDGDGTPKDANRRWPDLLAERLRRAGAGHVGVLNQGLIGNRLLRDSPLDKRNPLGPGFGPAGLARFEADALEQPGAACVLLRLGINDIGLPGSYAAPREMPTAGQLIDGYRRLIAQARGRGLRIVGSTLTPFEGADEGYYTPTKDALRQAVNAWLRHGGEFDALIDADKVLRDPEHPARLLPAFDSGDHLHPNEAGYAALAEALPLAALGVR